MFSPWVKFVASWNCLGISLHSLAENNSLFWPILSRPTRHIFVLSHCKLSWEFHLVAYTAAGIPLCSPNSASNASLNVVLVWSSGLSSVSFVRVGPIGLVSFKPSPPHKLKWMHHCRQVCFANAAFTISMSSTGRSFQSSGQTSFCRVQESSQICLAVCWPLKCSHEKRLYHNCKPWSSFYM